MISACHEKRGSALLIVLGFVAFMVVSAVSFAVYMRTERVASSGFHRTITARELVRAGLARAMQEIDYRVEDNPFPGIDKQAKGGDRWPNRVLSPGYDTLGLSPERTYPVLCLEALSYLPPALVNEVRAQARETSTAMWRPLAFEAGRYAFVAVNVSDMFDVNKVRFSEGRTCAPNGHVSLGYLYQNAAGNSMLKAPLDLAGLDAFLARESGVSYRSDIPFVSMADFNAALFGASSLASVMRSPFYDYLSGSETYRFYAKNGTSEIGTGLAATPPAKAMLFTAGSWMQPTNSAEIVDLAKESNQPFRKADLDNMNLRLDEIMSRFSGAGTCQKLCEGLSILTLANLYDYLDKDSVPLSLAYPNVERVPMIASVNLCPLGSALKLELEETSVDPSPADSPQFRTTTWALKPSGVGLVSGVLLYPFKHGEDPSGFKVQVCLKLYFADPGCGSRSTRNLCPGRTAWPNSESISVEAGGVVTAFSSPVPVNAKLADDENDAAIDFMATLPNFSNAAADLKNSYPVLRRKVQVQRDESGNYVEVPNTPAVVSAKLCPYKANGLTMSDMLDPLNDITLQPNAKEPTRGGQKFEPRVAVWVRVIDASGKTVDLSPASVEDDELNGISFGPLAIAQHGIFNLGDGFSLLAMKGNNANQLEFTDGLGKATLPAGNAFAGSTGCFVAIDPRYNFCAEDFIAAVNPSYGKNNYLSDVAAVLGNEGRDSDVFMFCSNQEFLQSIGELAFLPRNGELSEDANTVCAEYRANLTGEWYADSFASMSEEKSHKKSFWRTYRLYKQDGQASDGIYEYFSDLVNGLNDYRVSPYSDLLNVQLAVTANTPIDYWASSTNRNCSSVAKLDANERLKYAFNELPGTEAKLAWQDVTNLTTTLFGEIRAKAVSRDPGAWERAMENLEWHDSSGNGDSIFGVSLSGNSDPLDGIDRKMMYSWWHDSMACRQQLFLVFVRAEATPFGAPSSVESKEAGSSQLGARAVALVWRDPAPELGASDIGLPETIDESDKNICRELGLGNTRFGVNRYVPHRMRVLFYHQFE